MNKDYSKYNADDFLTDEYFVDSMLTPSVESEAFWKLQIDENNIVVNEFISAYMTLKSLKENKPEVSSEQLDKLWNRIVETNLSKQKRISWVRIVRYTAVACTIVGVIGISLLSVLKLRNANEVQSISDFAKENIFNTKQSSDKIQLISENSTLTVEGVQAKVEYDEKGKLKINKQSVFANASSAMPKKEMPEFNQLKVPYGKRAFLKLSDGSSLWVNTGTTVIYPSNFAKDKREIYVEGEVYAEVFHDANHPFIIKTEKLDVRVLGTVLNVTAYREDELVNVVLVNGSVDIKPQKGKSTIMKPNQLYSYSSQCTTLSNVEVENYTSWHNGNLIFKSEPIENILLRLSRYYNVTMELPSYPSGISCSGKLELKDDLDHLLNSLSEITSMSYAIKDNEYKIKFE